MDDFNFTMITIVLVVVMLTVSITYINYQQDGITEALDDRIDKSFTNANQHHEDIREDIKALCSMIDNCEMIKR